VLRAFSLRRQVFRAWQQLSAAVRAHDLRRHELAEQFFAAEAVPHLPDGPPPMPSSSRRSGRRSSSADRSRRSSVRFGHGRCLTPDMAIQDVAR
jgi:hypothetical protein